MNELERLNSRIEKLTQKRADALRELRGKCQHLHLAEGTIRGSRPYRICIDCGAEEEGWHCGFHVLVLQSEVEWNWYDGPRVVRGIVEKGSGWIKYRKDGPLYFVGQSHPNFAGGGQKTYKQLTAQ